MIIENSKQIGALVRGRRKQLKATQKDLAMSCGTGLRFIVDLERGKPTCHVGKMFHVLKSLGIHLEVVDEHGRDES
jgi:HTH-type transcriptional regulator/antitoxin HipB